MDVCKQNWVWYSQVYLRMDFFQFTDIYYGILKIYYFIININVDLQGKLQIWLQLHERKSFTCKQTNKNTYLQKLVQF